MGFGLGDCTCKLLMELPLLLFHFQEHINKSQEIQNISRNEKKDRTKRKEEIFHLFARRHYLWDCDRGTQTLRDCILLIDLPLWFNISFKNVLNSFKKSKSFQRTKKDGTKTKDLETTVGSGFGTWKPWPQHRLPKLATLQCVVILPHSYYFLCYVHIDHNFWSILFLIGVRKSSSTHF